jgi:hypothetical protein
MRERNVGPPGKKSSAVFAPLGLCTRRALAKRKSKLRKDAAEVDPKDVSRFHKMEALATELTRTSLVPTRVGGRARDTIKELGN